MRSFLIEIPHRLAESAFSVDSSADRQSESAENPLGLAPAPATLDRFGGISHEKFPLCLCITNITFKFVEHDFTPTLLGFSGFLPPSWACSSTLSACRDYDSQATPGFRAFPAGT
jgi:hypothetical protein